MAEIGRPSPARSPANPAMLTPPPSIKVPLLPNDHSEDQSDTPQKVRHHLQPRIFLLNVPLLIFSVPLLHDAYSSILRACLFAGTKDA